MRWIAAALLALGLAGCGDGRPGPSDPCERMDYMSYQHEGDWPGGIEGFAADFEQASKACREQMGY